MNNLQEEVYEESKDNGGDNSPVFSFKKHCFTETIS